MVLLIIWYYVILYKRILHIYSFGYNQILNLKKIQYFVKNNSLVEVRQLEIKQRCLELWKVKYIIAVCDYCIQFVLMMANSVKLP